MGNIVSAVCITGAALAIAKPACDYTVRAVLDRIAVVEADVKKAITLLEEAKKGAANDQAGKELYSEAMVLQAIESIDNTNRTVNMLPGRLSRVEEVVLQNVEGVERANGAISVLPDKIDETARKYSTYLHDEHVNIFELVSGKENKV